MAAQPTNFFESLVNVPVLYDRLKPEHYGKIGIPHKFYCTRETQTVLERFFQDLFARTVPRFGPVQRILSAGAWVNKPGQHGLGKAFDLDAIHWEHVHFIALQQPVQKTLYLAVQAACNKHFGITLGYDYNPDHHDHLHIDISRPVRFRETNSVTSFLQQALNTFYGHTLKIDGEYGEDTEQALNGTLAVLGIPDVATPENWRRFLDAACNEGINRVAAALDAEGIAATPHVEMVVASSVGLSLETDLISAMADIEANPFLPAAEEVSIEAPSILAVRPDIGRIDLSYKPFDRWAINSKMVGNKEQWFADFDGVNHFYLGYQFTFQDTYIGLARTGSSAATQIPYDHQEHRPKFGDWASFIQPTAECESEAQFLVVNSWDAAAFTLGFFQMAGAHRGAFGRSLPRTHRCLA